jgi:hypothetical protein
MLAGTIASRTSGSGQCRRPMAMKVASAISGAMTARPLSGLLNNGRAILATVASINPAAAAATPVSMRRSAGRSPNWAYSAPTMMIKIIGGPSSPATAAKAPSGPRMRAPNITAKLTMLPPGRKAHSAKASLNCSAVNQRRRSTMIRRVQASTPPKPHSEIVAKARNNSAMFGRARVAGWALGAGAGGAGGPAGELAGELIGVLYA